MFNNKIILVIGGSGLIGKSISESILNNKGIPIIADKIQSNLDLDYFRLDINSEEEIKSCIDYIKGKYKRLDGVINVSYPRNKNYGRKFFDVNYSDFCENINLHLGSYFLVLKLFSEYFIEQGYGNIISFSSIYGVIAPKFEIYEGTEMTVPVEYNVIKSGIINLTKYLAKYLKGKNIRVNTISPGGIFDNQPESFLKKYKDNCINKGMLDTSDIIGTVLFLLSDNSRYINGQNIIVDDGFTL